MKKNAIKSCSWLAPNFFLYTDPATQTAQKQKSPTTKSPLCRTGYLDWVADRESFLSTNEVFYLLLLDLHSRQKKSEYLGTFLGKHKLTFDKSVSIVSNHEFRQRTKYAKWRLCTKWENIVRHKIVHEHNWPNCYFIDLSWVASHLGGHSLTTWTKWGGRGSKNVFYCPCPKCKNCPRRGEGQKMAKFCPRGCWMPP